MENLDLNDTAPFPVPPASVDEPPKPVEKKRSPWKRFTLLAILALFLIGALSAYAGYSSGIAQRQQAEVALISAKASEQFELAIQDIANREFQRARQRLEYVAQVDPNYPELTNRLAEVIAQINATATPTPVPTPTTIATADTRGSDELFTQGQQLMNNGDWPGAIETLLKLRKDDPNYRQVEIDGLLFLALRNRGLDKIAKQADLEGGLYDLTLSSSFGPLDNEAQGYINWVSLYITGASFWELDWQKVVEYFSQVGVALPGLTDRSGLTARERYRLGLKGYATTLAAAGDYCAAAEQYQLSLSIGADPEVDLLFAEAYNACQGVEEEELPADEVPVLTESALPPAATIPPPVETLPPPEPTVEPSPYPTP